MHRHFHDPEDAVSVAAVDPGAAPRPDTPTPALLAASPQGAARRADTTGGPTARTVRGGRCQNPDCARRFTQAHVGRPRKYCTDACRLASRGGRGARSAPRRAEHDGYVREIVQDIRARSAALGRGVTADQDDVLARIHQAHLLARDADDLMAALVQQARDRQVPMRDIAALLNISPDTVRRHWRNRPLGDRMRARRRRNSQQRPTPTGPRVGTRPAGTGRPRAGGAVDDGSLARFAGALSHLQRTSGKSLRVLGQECGISASYVSRVLSGERCPTWPVACRLISACAGDPTELHTLWEAARGYVTTVGAQPTAHALRAALRGLHLAAARPRAETVSRLTGHRLDAADVEGLLHGATLPDWEAVDAFVHALRGSCVPIRRLWNTALHESVTRNASGLHDAERDDGLGGTTTPPGSRPHPAGRRSEAAPPEPSGRPRAAHAGADHSAGAGEGVDERERGGRREGHREGHRAGHRASHRRSTGR